jgi:hypothetical protein
VILIDQWCTFQNNFNIDLDDEAAPGLPPCPFNNGNTYQPENPLAAFIGEESEGTWVLTIQDLATGDGGSLNSWALEICVAGGCSVIVTNNGNSGDGTFRDALLCAASGDTITFAPSMFGSTINLSTPLVISKDIVIQSSVAQNITFNASQTSHAIEVAISNDVIISGLTVTGGSALAGSGIQNNGNLTLQDVTINPGPSSNGSLLANFGTLSLEGDCQISD